MREPNLILDRQKFELYEGKRIELASNSFKLRRKKAQQLKIN
jgi:hypothetical protein